FLRDLMRAADVLAVGPGLTAGEETSALVREIVSGSSLPVVLDADGLNAYAGRASELKGDPRVLILTPHPGEMARLLSRPGSPAGPGAVAPRGDRPRVCRGAYMLPGAQGTQDPRGRAGRPGLGQPDGQSGHGDRRHRRRTHRCDRRSARPGAVAPRELSARRL